MTCRPARRNVSWSPTSSTLVYGARDAVLVDPLLTIKEAALLADWVEASGKNLTTIYATHGHGDHFFGATAIVRRFPDARFVATRKVVEVMRKQASPPTFTNVWTTLFPAQLPEHPLIADELTDQRDRPRGSPADRCGRRTYRHGHHDVPSCAGHWSRRRR